MITLSDNTYRYQNGYRTWRNKQQQTLDFNQNTVTVIDWRKYWRFDKKSMPIIHLVILNNAWNTNQ